MKQVNVTIIRPFQIQQVHLVLYQQHLAVRNKHSPVQSPPINFVS